MQTAPISAAVLIAIVVAVPASALTWHVPSECATIQAGIDSAAVGDTVLVVCDTYYEHDIEMKSGVCVRSATGDADCVTIDAQQSGRVFRCHNVDAAASIVGFTLTGGRAEGEEQADCRGGAAYCTYSSPTLINCVFSGNSAMGTGARGGGLACFYCSSPTLIDCCFSNNYSDFAGGGMSCGVGSSPVLNGCAFSDNSSVNYGGGFCCVDASAELVDCTFFRNSATDPYSVGGGACCHSSSSPTFTDCRFVDNSANSGGGMICLSYSSPTIMRCAFSDNSAWHAGGGVRCLSLSSPTLTRCVFFKNTATSKGGAIDSHHSFPTISRCVVIDNAAGAGGGVHTDLNSLVELGNTIIASGTSGGAVRSSQGGSATLVCCDLWGNVGGDWTGFIADQCGINGNISFDPCFCDDSYMLGEPSPCAPDNSPEGCGLIGVLGVGCADCGWPVPVAPTSWGSIKSMFR